MCLRLQGHSRPAHSEDQGGTKVVLARAQAPRSPLSCLAGYRFLPAGGSFRLRGLWWCPMRLAIPVKPTKAEGGTRLESYRRRSGSGRVGAGSAELWPPHPTPPRQQRGQQPGHLSSAVYTRPVSSGLTLLCGKPRKDTLPQHQNRRGLRGSSEQAIARGTEIKGTSGHHSS